MTRENILGEIVGGGKLKKEYLKNYSIKILRKYAESLKIKIKKKDKLINKEDLIKKIKKKID